MKDNISSHVVRLAARKSHTFEPVVVSRKLDFREKQNVQPTTMLFSEGYFGKIATLFLIPMLFIYPIAPAFADEGGAPSAPAEATAEVAASETPAPVDPVEPPATENAEVPAEQETPPADAEEIAESTPADETATSETPPDEPSEGSEVPPADEPSESTEEPPVETASTTPEEAATSTDEVATSTDATTTPEIARATTDVAGEILPTGGGAVQNEVAAEEIAPEAAPEEVASEEQSGPTPEEQAAEAERRKTEIEREREDALRANIRKEVESEFTKGCLTVDNVGYYCLKDSVSGGNSLAPSLTVTGVSAQLDAAGAYKQIFMTKGGESIQLTHDSWNNAFPSTDISGKSIVWQGEVAGRWQIFFSDQSATSSAPVFTQVTHAHESNFNPHVDGNDVVWQAWVDGNWEVYWAERIAAKDIPSDTSDETLPQENKRLGVDHSWKITRITANSVHDMFPRVAGGLITWQSFQDNAWSVYAYSIKTGATTKLSSSGAKSQNPRFAITWDEQTPEGSARMVGYDIGSGETLDLTSQARQVSNNSAPYHPTDAPISQDNQAALPISSAGTSTTMKSDGDGGDGSTDNGLDI